MFLHRDDYGKTDKDEDFVDNGLSVTELTIKKHRNGSLAELEFMFDKNIGKFMNMERE